ncbi:hypothetical protein [Streptomyces sp. NPDC004291]
MQGSSSSLCRDCLFDLPSAGVIFRLARDGWARSDKYGEKKLVEIVQLAEEGVPTSAKFFLMACGAGFIAFGLLFFFRSRNLSAFMTEKISVMGSPQPAVPASESRIRVFGGISSVVGISLVVSSLVLLQ